MSSAPQDTVTRTVAVSRARSQRKRLRPRKALLGLAGIVVFLLVWEAAALTGVVDPRYLPPPSRVLPELVHIVTLTDFWGAVGDTLLQWGLGLAIALVLGAGLGIVVGLSPFLRRFTNSTVEFLRPIPSVALIPLAVLLFGIGIEASLLLVAYAAFWQIFIQVLYGVADIDQVAMNTGRSYNFSAWQRVRSIVFPTTLPYLMTGLRLAAAVALILAVTAQLVIGTAGLGREIVRAQNAAQYPVMYALILATGLLGVLINIGARLLERRLLSWHHSVREDAPA